MKTIQRTIMTLLFAALAFVSAGANVSLNEPVVSDSTSFSDGISAKKAKERISNLYIVGSFNNWNCYDGTRLEMSPISNGFMSVVELPDCEFKLISFDDNDNITWYGGVDNNYVGYYWISEQLIGEKIPLVDGSNFRINGGIYTFTVTEDDSGMNLVVYEGAVSSGAVLTVNLPSNASDGRYGDMYLSVASADGATHIRRIITDKISYSFYVPTNATYNVSVITGSGGVAGEKRGITIGSDDVTVSIASLLQPQTVSMAVTLPDGVDITAETGITWTDKDGNFLAQGAILDGMIQGQELNYELKLPQEQIMTYIQPAKQNYIVKSQANSILVRLRPFGTAKITGTVYDASTGRPLAATITASQSLNGKRTQSVTTTTNDEGQYTLDVVSAPAIVTTSAQWYVLQTVKLDTIFGSTALEPQHLTPIEIKEVQARLTYRPSAPAGQNAETLDYYDDYQNVSFTIRNLTRNSDVTPLVVQYPKIILSDDVTDGDVIEVTAHSLKNVFNDVKATCTIALGRGDVTFPLVEHGGIDARYTSSEAASVSGMLYNSKGEQVARDVYRDTTFSLRQLPDGNYTLVSMQTADNYNSVLTLAGLSDAGLTEGADYKTSSVSVISGTVTSVEVGNVPAINYEMLSYTGKNTHFTANKSSLTIRDYITLTANIDFKKVYQGEVKNVKLMVDLPEDCDLVANSVLLGNVTTSYIVEGNRVSVSVPNDGGLVKFCVIPTLAGTIRPSASVQFAYDDKTITEPIGAAVFEAKNFEITVPPTTSTPKIVVSGFAPFESNVEVFDGDKLVGVTTTSASGVWSLNITFADTIDNSVHEIHACATTKQGYKLLSQRAECQLTKNLVYPEVITLIYRNSKSMIYPQELRSTGYYSYAPGQPEFTFLAKFNIANPERLFNVRFNVLASDGNIRCIPATFDENTAQWIACADYPNSSSLPVNVNVSFIDTIASPIDLTSLFTYDIEREKKQLSEKEEDFSNNFSVDNIVDGEYGVSFDCVSGIYGEIWKCSVAEIDYAAIIAEMNSSDEYVKVGDDEKNLWVKSWISDGIAHVNYVDKQEQKAIRADLITEQRSANGPQRVSVVSLASPLVSTVFAGLHMYQTDKSVSRFITEMIKMNDRMLAMSSLKCADGTYLFDDETRLEILDFVHSNYTSMAQLNNYQTVIFDKFGDAWAQSLFADFITGEILDLYEVALPTSLASFTDILKFVSQPTITGVSSFTQEIMGGYYHVGNEILKEFAKGYNIMQKENLRFMRMWNNKKRKCSNEETPEVTEEDYLTPPIKPTIDPSGFVYEAVQSNRLQGVTATIYYKETIEDMYGNPQENEVLWDAEEFAQKNPLFTEENGMYQWDVPQGMWQVRFNKTGYEPARSEWLPVPPPQLDVNIGMTQLRQPEVAMVHAYKDAVEITFDKYMRPATLTTDNILLTQNNKAVSGTIELLNAEPGDNETLASKIQFVPANDLSAGSVTLTVKTPVESYAGITMNSEFQQSFDVERRVRVISVDSLVNVGYGESRKVTVAALPVDIASGATLRVTTNQPVIADVDEETFTLDKHGRAEITVNGNLPGSATLTFGVDGFDLRSHAKVLVVDESALVTAKPVASVGNGKVFGDKIEVELSCETPRAEIYYTIDGSCPCDPEERIRYTGPITITSSTTLKAIAVAPDHYESDIATYYYFQSSAVTEVNTDSPVRIAPTVVTDEFSVTGHFESCDIRVFSLNGAEVVHQPAIRVGQSVSMSGVQAGVYIVVVTVNGRPYPARIIKVE